MNENIVDVLIYLYENYMEGDTTPPQDQRELRDELDQAGFSIEDIERAFQWLDELAEQQSSPGVRASMGSSFRCFSEQEVQRLDTDARGLVLFLEQNDILDQESRELVIERALALDAPEIGVEELKWVVLLVLMNRPGRETAFAHMEDLVFSDIPAYLH
jgi:Smg protein